MLAASSRLGPYEIIAPLGAGGMGEVYRARDTRLGREVAVKVLPEPFANNPDCLARFEREARAVAALSHPNILSILDYGTCEATTYAVMELLEGETLRGRLTKGPIPWREAIEIGAAITEGLAAAHIKGIIHRDLKPENLFLTADGRVKILDFGLARIMPVSNFQSETGLYVPGETNPGMVLGTVGYMSPEQVRGQPAGAPSDLFSFGCVLYEMVTGQRAFHRETAAETMTAILRDEPADPTDSGNQIPAELGRLIRQCLAKNAHQRLQSARDLSLGLRTTATDPGLHRSVVTRPRLRLTVGIGATLLLIGAIATSVYLLATGGYHPEATRLAAEAKAIDAVAVLPFENVGGDPRMEHLSEGIPDTIIHGLSRLRLRDLKVQSLTAVARYKGRKPDLGEVRRELGVGAVITGRLQQRGDRLSVSVALIDVRDGSEVWGQQYDRTLNDILALQDEIARDIAANLRLHLTGEQQQHLTRRYTENPEAYQLYLKGRYFWNKRRGDALEKAIEYFRKAIDVDPTCAQAYAGLADAYAVFPDNTDTRPSESFPKAKAAAEKALEIDNQLADALATLAFIASVGEWNWSEAEQRFKQAIALDPNNANARKWYGQCLTSMGRFDEAETQYRRARDLDPLSLIISTTAGFGDFYARRYDAAIAQYRKTLEMDPDFWVAHIFLGQAYIEKGMYEEALGELQTVRRIAPGHLQPLSLMGRTCALMGKRPEALMVIDELSTLSQQRYVPPCRVAVVYASLRENQQALDWLEKAYEGQCSLLRDLKVEPAYNDLHDEPRFIDLLRRIGLVDKATGRDQGVQSVAVLPLVYDGADSKTDLLCSTLAGHIIDSLGQVHRADLKVRPFSSVARYKQDRPDHPTIARKLNVALIVTGTLQEEGDNLVIRVEVVDAREDHLLWSSKPYPPIQRGGNPDLDLQERIVRDVAAHLGLRLTADEEQRLTHRPTADKEANRLYREAMYHFNKFSPPELNAAINLCKQAISRDPKYAIVYAALARCYILQGAVHLGPRQTFPEARQRVAEALKLDPDQADAHAALGAIHLFEDWDWKGAERELSLALRLDPNVMTTRNIYGFCMAAQGRLPEALASIARGQELDPLAAARRNELAMCYNWLHQYDQAIAEAQKAIELDPNFALAYCELGLAYSQQENQHAEAIQALRTAVERGNSHPRMRGLLGYAYAAAGQKEESRKEMKALLEERRYGTAFALARIHAALGEKDEAFQRLQEALDERDSIVIWLKFDPTLDNLRSDARFMKLLIDMALPP